MKVMPINNPVVPCAYKNLSESNDVLTAPKITYRLNDNVLLRVSKTEGLVMPPHGNKGRMDDPLSIDLNMLDILRRQIFTIPEIPENSLKLLLETETIIPYDGRTPGGIKTFYSENFNGLHYAILEITRKCQCRCTMCYQDFSAAPDDPSIELIRRRLKKIKDFGVFWVEIFGGEPLMRPDLPQILDYAKELGLEITISTNGEFLTKDKLPHVQEIRKTRISIDAFGEIHNQTRNRDGLFDKAIAALDLLYQNNCPVIVTATVSNENIMGLEPLLEFLTGNYPLLPITVRKAKIKPEQGLKHINFNEIKQRFIDSPSVSFLGLEGKEFTHFENASMGAGPCPVLFT